MSKSSNIIRWVVFGVLALITVALAAWYYLGLSFIDSSLPDDAKREMQSALAEPALNWGYINVILGLILVLVSAVIVCVVAIGKGVPGIKAIALGVAFGALILLLLLALPISHSLTPAEGGTFITGAGRVVVVKPWSWVDWVLDGFYFFFGIGILVIIISAIVNLIKKAL